MPKQFDDCVSGGGKVRTIVPGKGKYLHICYPKGGGPSVSREVKTKKTIPKKKISKTKKMTNKKVKKAMSFLKNKRSKK